MKLPTKTAFAPARYSRAVADVLRDLGPGEIASRLAIGAAAIGATIWVQQTQETFWGAVALGVALTGVIGSVTEILIEAVVRMRQAQLWHAPGRVVHHLNLGACTVLDYDDRPELERTWLLIQPLQHGEGPSALWIEDGPQIAGTNTELLARWDRGDL